MPCSNSGTKSSVAAAEAGSRCSNRPCRSLVRSQSCSLPAARGAAVLELDEMKIESSDAFFTMTLDLAGSLQPPFARRDANGDIAVEVRNCVAGPSLSDVYLEEGMVRAVELESFKVGGQPALRLRVRRADRVPVRAGLRRRAIRFAGNGRHRGGAREPLARVYPSVAPALDMASAEGSADSDSEDIAEESPWRKQLLSATLDDLQQELEESRARERAMRQELEQARQRLREAQTPNAELEAEVERYRELVRQLLDQNDDLSRRLIEAQRVDPERDSIISELRATEAELRGELQIARQALGLARIDREGLAGRLQEAEEEVDQLVQVNRELSRQKEEALDLAEADGEGLAARLQSAQEEVGQLVEDNRALSRQKEGAETALSEVRAREEDLQLERTELEETLESAREEIRQLVLLNASLQEVRRVTGQAPPVATPLPIAATPPPVTQAVVGMAAAPCLRLRRRPGFGGEILNCLPPGTAVALLEERSGWSRIRLASGVHQQGWVAAPYLEERRQQTTGEQDQSSSYPLG